MGRNLCYFIDGTNAFAGGLNGRPSCVYWLSVMLTDFSKTNADQIIFYSAGPGSKNKSQIKQSSIFGTDVETICKSIYVSLICNYRDGDRIHFFGWSRGSAACRILTYIIQGYGILKPDYIEEMDNVWKMVRDRRSPPLRNNTSCSYPRVSLLALFDSVVFLTDSYFIRKVLGVKFNVRFSDTDLRLSANVDTAIHLVSIDEQSKIFPVTPFTGKARQESKLLQMYMPGSHGDIGGCCKTLCNYAALITMKNLSMRNSDLKFSPNIMNVVPEEYMENFSNIRKSRLSIKRWPNDRRRIRDYNFVDGFYFDKAHPIFRRLRSDRNPSVTVCNSGRVSPYNWPPA